jgi:hypothetical protein
MKPNDELLVSQMVVVAVLVLVAIGLATCAVVGDSAWMAAAAQDRTVPARLAVGGRAQIDTTGQDMRPAVVAARVCAKEAGLTGKTEPDGERRYDDCKGIVQTLYRLGHNNVVRGAMAHSVRVFVPERLGINRWVVWLNAAGDEPRDWSPRIPWASDSRPELARRNHWLALLEFTRAVLRDGAPRCRDPEGRPTVPSTWGMRSGGDWERAIAGRWTPIDCGSPGSETLNAFWRYRRRAP